MKQERIGELYLVSSAVLWSLLPVVTVLTYSDLTPLWTVAISNGIGIVPFAVVITLKGSWLQIWKREAWASVLMTALFNGLLFHFFLFMALTETSPGNVSLLGQMEVFFSFLILTLWGKERLFKPHFLGAIFMVLGAVLILAENKFEWNNGNLYMLCATALAPVGNNFNQEARKIIDASTALFLRSSLTTPVFLILALIYERTLTPAKLSHSFIFLIINGIFMFGLAKLFWLEAIHRIPITKAVSLAAFGPGLTLIFAAVILGQKPTTAQLIAFGPLVICTVLLTRRAGGEKTTVILGSESGIGD
ncbi:MAG: DMT family transporter [Candidatus Dadabacteria bacterium]|nr:MAG: DMT family transporter [Candidatus Dadabacteria bacterium]